MGDSISRRVYLAERQGLLPVSPELRQGGFWPLFSIFCNSLLNPATLVTSGLMITAGFSLIATVGIQTCSVVLGMLPFLVLAQVGVKEGIPGQVYCRAVFGHNGSRWLTSPLRVLCSIYWYAFQTIASMMAVEAILSKCFEIEIPLGWLAAGFAALQGGVALLGYSGVSRLSGITLPFKLIIFMVLILWLIQNGGPAAAFSHVVSYQAGSWKWAVALAWSNGIFSSMLTLVTDAADFSRYTRKVWYMEAGVVTGTLVGTAVGAFFGGWCVITGGLISINPFASIVELNPDAWILLLIMLVTVLDAWTINVLNLYTGGFSLANSVPVLGRCYATGLVVMAATGLSLLPDIVHRYVDVLSAIGAIFGPVGGALLAWAWMNKSHLDVSALYRPHEKYGYWKGWNWMTCVPIIPLSIMSLYLSRSFLPALVSFSACFVWCWLIVPANRKVSGSD